MSRPSSTLARGGAAFQPSLPHVVHQRPESGYSYGERSSGAAHGLVLTKPHIVDLMLDLAGYTKDKDLGSLSLLEPACGHGAFLLRAVDRLCLSAKSHGRDLEGLIGAIRGYDVDPAHVARSIEGIAQILVQHEVPRRAAQRLAQSWVRKDDFLLQIPPAQGDRFDVILGNPPYVRIEQIPLDLQKEYRRRYQTLFDRADLYVAFIEQGLHMLSKGGVLCFICADRWTLNRYGAPLRKMLADGYRIRTYIELHRASPFESEVIAYPSIFVVSPGQTENVEVGSLEAGSPEECQAIAAAGSLLDAAHPGVKASIYRSWFSGDEPWVLSTERHLRTLRELEARFDLIEAHGRARVGIGVATGNDSVYIVDSAVDIEEDRLVPLAMRQDIEGGAIRESRRRVINTFDDQGVVDLARYPRLARYLRQHEEPIRKRHVAQKAGAGWFRTIDRIWPELIEQPKLFIPDIAGANEVVLDGAAGRGRFYPHHNLYFVSSPTWDMEVLGGLLSSRVALFFVWSYAVKMRGSYLRFQAQYLRRIRVPAPEQIAAGLAEEIRQAFRRRDFVALDELALSAYGLDDIPEFDYVDTRR